MFELSLTSPPTYDGAIFAAPAYLKKFYFRSPGSVRKAGTATLYYPTSSIKHQHQASSIITRPTPSAAAAGQSCGCSAESRFVSASDCLGCWGRCWYCFCCLRKVLLLLVDKDDDNDLLLGNYGHTARAKHCCC